VLLWIWCYCWRIICNLPACGVVTMTKIYTPCKIIEDIDHTNNVKYNITRSDTKDHESIIFIEVYRKDKKENWKYETGCYLDIEALRYLVK